MREQQRQAFASPQDVNPSRGLEKYLITDCAGRYAGGECFVTVLCPDSSSSGSSGWTCAPRSVVYIGSSVQRAYLARFHAGTVQIIAHSVRAVYSFKGISRGPGLSGKLKRCVSPAAR